uniref:Phenylalanine--tRNA ligase beta subunit n=1 Tax=Bangiopsis subsimplex TaxID=139980 RepID=A0A1C9CCI9_9RHOD|nr:phenylalanyl-tRNA synthetase beta chain [Bangiopsis subsimplex]AOM66110.1 phenylalanyl-tRNA synthetase beta chain [Bangiopsis subsimplex]ARO90333.1 phenylalanyl tRNA synthetase beta subunit [Bangiopsis subsimplex]
MKISFRWLISLLETKDIPIDDLAEKLTFAGFEVDSIEYISSDIILDIATTANRGDCLSMIGIAREVAALYNLEYKPFKEIQTIQSYNSNLISFTNLNACNFYSITLINHIKISPSPQWLQTILSNLGIMPENNIYDIINYILLKYGTPFHVFNLSEDIVSQTLECKVENNLSGEKITLRNLGIHQLPTDCLVTKLNGNIASLSGIIEQADYRVSNNTSIIALEAAFFDPTVIRQSSTRCNLKTEASLRFEKGIDVSLIYHAYNECIELIKDFTKGNLLACSQKNILKNTRKIIPLNITKLKSVLGRSDHNTLTLFNIEQIFRNLGFNFTPTNQGWDMEVPSHRNNDIDREIDLIEEVGRIVGYNHFEAIMPRKNFGNSFSQRNKISKYIKNFFISHGFNEVVHYSFEESKDFLNDIANVKITNPLNIDQQYLRTSLLPELLKTHNYNLTQNNTSSNLFEISRIFQINNNQKQEYDFIASAWGGYPIKTTWSSKPTYLNWFEAKGFIENFFHFMNISVSWNQNLSSPYCGNKLFHHTRWTNIQYKNENVGIFAQLHPKWQKIYNISYNMYLIEVNLERIYTIINKITYKNYLFKSYSIYPSISRDINILVPIKTSVGTILKTIRQTKNPFLISINLFDDYQDKSLKNHKRLTFRLIYRSNTETLKVDIIEKYTYEIQQILENYSK